MVSRLKETKCLFCRKADKHEHGWEECSKCGSWAHVKCASFDEESEDEWICPKCADSDILLKVPGKKTKKSGATSDSGTVPGAGSTKVPTEEELAAEQRAEREAFAKQMEVRKKRLADKLAWSEQKMKEEAEMQELELKLQAEIEKKQIAHDQELLERQLAAEKEFLKKRAALRKQIDESKAKVAALKAEKKVADRLKDGYKPGTGSGAKPKPEVTPEDSSSDDDDDDDDEKSSVKSASKESGSVKKSDGGGGSVARITREQMAARKVVSHALPKFRGEPEVWPLFISCFQYTTEACGFSNIENLTRLVEALDGEALDHVRSRLSYPHAVPEIIEDLRDFFGRPEKLMRMLLAKVKQTPAPQADRLGTFISFGVAVKQLCDHLEAANLHDHLHNPMLVQELVEKLPPSYQMEWVRFRRGKKKSPLRMFTDFMKGIVKDAAEVADLTSQDSSDQSRSGSRKPHKESVHVHDMEERRIEAPRFEESSKFCWICKRTDHLIRSCDDFKRMNVGERLEEVERHNLCHRCLNNHGSSPCHFRGRCTVPNCGGNHHPLLHRAEETVQLQKAENSSRSVIFRMMPVTLHAGNRQYDTVAFLDEGSSATLMDDEVAKQLEAEGVPEPLMVTWTGNINRIEDGSRKVDLLLSAKGSTEKFPLTTRTVDELLLPQQEVNYPELVKKYKHLSGVPLADLPSGVPTILIGLDNLHLFAPQESRIGQPCEPIAVRSKVGWTVYGTEKRRPRRNVHLNVHTVTPANNRHVPRVRKKQYRLDDKASSTFSIPEPAEETRGQENRETTTKAEGVGLLRHGNGKKNRTANRNVKLLHEKLEKNPALKKNELTNRQQNENNQPMHTQETSQELTKDIRGIVNECADKLANLLTNGSVNPLWTPHLGGVRERLMRSVNEALTALEDGRWLLDKRLRTAFVKAEDSRPALALPDKFQLNQQLAMVASDRRNDDLPTPNRRAEKFRETRPLQSDDRKQWMRGIEDEPIEGMDGQVHEAWVRTESGRCKGVVAELAVLRVRRGNPQPEADSLTGLRAGECSDNTVSRSLRRCKVKRDASTHCHCQ